MFHSDDYLIRSQIFPDHQLRGNLALGVGTRVISHRLSDQIGISEGEPPVVDVLMLSMDNQNVQARGFFMAYHYSRFFVEQGDTPLPQELLMSHFLGVLFNTIDYAKVLTNNNELEGHCRKAGFIPLFRIIRSVEDIIAVSEDPLTQQFLLRFGDGAEVFLSNRAQQLVMVGPLMLTIGKNIAPEGYIGWMTRRVRAMMGTMGLWSSDIIWTDATYPTMVVMGMISTFLSASHYLRREIFRTCWSAATNQSRIANLFKDIISLLKGTNMTHIILIDEYLYNRYRELLSMRPLAGNHKGMNAAWNYLASLPEHERYFAKILYDKEATACLNRVNFPLHIAAAVAAAQFETPSMQNYRGADVQAQTSETLGTIVRTYLNRRLEITPHAVLNAHASFASREELAAYRLIVDEERAGPSAALPALRGAPATIPPPPGPGV